MRDKQVFASIIIHRLYSSVIYNEFYITYVHLFLHTLQQYQKILRLMSTDH